MSKSLGNLVFVHKLVDAGVDPSAIRVGVYTGHYRGDRDWSDEVLATAQERLERWRAAAETPGSLETVQDTVQQVRAALADDLDTPRVLQILDDWAARATGTASAEAESAPDAAEQDEAQKLLRVAVNSLLGVRL